MSGPMHVIGLSLTGTTSGTSTPVAIPTDFNGVIPKAIRVAATGRCQFRFGDSSVSVVSAGYVTNPNDPGVFLIPGATHLAVVNGPDAGVVINFTPVEVF